MSPTFSISNPQLLSVFKGFLIAEGGAVLAVASVWLATGSFDLHSLLLLEGGAIGSTAVNFFRKYIPSTPAQ